MNKLFLFIAVLVTLTSAYSQQWKEFFPKSQLETVGVYYYPEHWDPSEWDRDLKNIADMGFEFTHYAEFAWAQLEPEEGKYDFAWLDKAVEIAAKYNLGVIMCTSTATPPVWLVREHPDVLQKMEDGNSFDHGARQHASFSSEYYRSYSLKMIEELAKHYGNDKRIIGWQVDNEPRIFEDFGEDAHRRFREWLKDKYKDIDELNEAWGTAFWSQHYSSFDEINIPRASQWGMNLHQRLDYRRFTAHETASFLDEQALMIKKYAMPEQWVTSNYIPSYDAGPIGMSHDLDFITYTKYVVSGYSKGLGEKGYRVGDPLSIAMSNDFFRPITPTYGVMELQPGQVNWGRINSQPLPGAVHMWLWHVFAGGSDLVCTYRYRAPIYGYEAHHAGIVGTDGVTPTIGGLEYEKFIDEVKLLRKEYNPKTSVPKSYLEMRTGLLFNPENLWGMDMNKQTVLWNSMGHVEKYYKPLKSFGAPVDFIRDTMDFSKYPVVVAPAFQQVDKELIAKWTKYVEDGGNLILSVRSGSKDREAHLWPMEYAEPIYNLIGAEIVFYDLLMDHDTDSVIYQGKSYPWQSWGDILKPLEGTEVWGTFKGDYYEGSAAITHRKLGKGTVTYVGADSNDGKLERDILKKIYQDLKLDIKDYPEGVLVEYRDGFGIAVNYSPDIYNMPLEKGEKILVGDQEIKTGGVLVWKLKNK